MQEDSLVWSEECQTCFKQLKNALCKPSILQYLDPAKPYLLFCDASNHAFAGVFAQTHNNPRLKTCCIHIQFLVTSSTMLVCN